MSKCIKGSEWLNEAVILVCCKNDVDVICSGSPKRASILFFFLKPRFEMLQTRILRERERGKRERERESLGRVQPNRMILYTAPRGVHIDTYVVHQTNHAFQAGFLQAANELSDLRDL